MRSLKSRIIYFAIFLTVFAFGCSNPFDSGSDKKNSGTTVRINMIDQTGQLDPNQKYIMSIYEEGNEDDYRYSKYSTERFAVWNNVEPDDYLAHCTSSWAIGENAVRINVKKGDHITINFYYYYWGDITIGNWYSGYYTVPYYKWKNTVKRS